jgi:hypothetical protein
MLGECRMLVPYATIKLVFTITETKVECTGHEDNDGRTVVHYLNLPGYTAGAEYQ